MAATNATNFRKNAYKYLSEVIKSNKPLQVNTKDGEAFIVSSEEYRKLTGLQETLYLNSIPGMANHILEGRADNEETVEVDWKNELQD